MCHLHSARRHGCGGIRSSAPLAGARADALAASNPTSAAVVKVLLRPMNRPPTPRPDDIAGTVAARRKWRQ